MPHIETIPIPEGAHFESLEQALNEWGLSIHHTQHISGYDVEVKCLQGKKEDKEKKIEGYPPAVQISFELHPRPGEFCGIPLMEIAASIVKRVKSSLNSTTW